MLITNSELRWSEADRLAALERYAILDTPTEAVFDEVAQLAAQVLGTPMAAVSLVDKERQWFKAEVGIGVRETPISDSICALAVLQHTSLVVPDALHDSRFECNTLVNGAMGLRFYAGSLLATPEGIPIGALCVLDTNPRPEGLNEQQKFALDTLAKQVMMQLELRLTVSRQKKLLEEQERIKNELRAERDRNQRILDGMEEGYVLVDANFRILHINAGGLRMDQRPASEIVGRTHWEAWPGSEDLPIAAAFKQALKDGQPVVLEQKYVFPDGREFWLDVRAYPADGGLAIFYRDITEKKYAEDALRTAEENLRNSHSYLRLLINCTNEGFYSVDRTGTTTLCNAAFLRMLGFEREEDALGKKLHAIIHHSHCDGSHYERDDCPIYRAAQTGEPAYVEEEVFFRMDGTSFPVQYSVQPVWRDGQLEGAVCTFIDLTERKKTEDTLRETVARLQFTLEAAQIGDWDLDLVTDTAYRSLRHDQCFGYNQPIADWGFEKFIQHVHVEDRERVEHQFRKAVAELGDWHFECRVVWSDQSIHWIAAHGKVYHVNQQPTKMSGIVFDITEQKEFEETLRRSERRALEAATMIESERRRLDALLEAAPVGIIVADAKGGILRVNSTNKRIWGENHPNAHSVEDYREWKGWWADGSVRHGQPLLPHDWAMARALRGEAARDIVEIASFDNPPVRRIILNSGSSIRGSEGEITGAVVAQMDITDRVRAEEALRDADRRKDEFLAMLAHELRNPLAPISAAGELMEMANLDETLIRRSSQVINRQIRHMTGLVDDLLDVSRVTRGLIKLEKTDLDLKRIVSDAVEQVGPIIEAKSHRLTVELPPESAHVIGDQKRLVQILSNLLNNSAKYTPKGGNIHLRMEVRNDQVMLRIADNGIGIAPQFQTHIFELFAQAERASDRSQGGLGIGLALVKSLVELHSGKVTCYSEGAGKGSEFTICLPRVIKQDASAERRESNQQLYGAKKKLNILVVDDNSDAAQMLAMLMQAFGHDVIIENDSRKALERAKTETLDVCMLDIGLPEMDGNELARRLRGLPGMDKTTLIAVTGYGQEQDQKAALNAGFDHHLVKPVEMTKLASLLAKVSET